MKRLLFQAPLPFLLLFFLNFSIQAQITWQGGASEDWHDEDNWRPDVVPGIGDDVLIPDNSGTIYYYPKSTIEGVDVGANSHLIIDEDAVLAVTGNLTAGIIVRGNGQITNLGEIGISDIDSDGIDLQTGSVFDNYGLIYMKEIDEEGIQTEGAFTNHESGMIDLVEVRRRAVNVRYGSFINKGAITCLPSSVGTGIAVIQGGSFENGREGVIILENNYRGGITMSGNGTFRNNGFLGMASIPLASAIQMNSATFENKTHGEIDIDLSGSKNGIKLSSQSQFDNQGELSIRGGNSASSRGITVEGTSTFNNGASGDIFTSRRNFGIYVSSSVANAFVNEGRIRLWKSSGAGINNFGTFVNKSTLIIYRSTGIHNKNTGVFSNEGGSINIKGGSNYWNIKNENELTNHPCSEMLFQGKIENLSPNFNNYGYMESAADGADFSGGNDLNNYGVILDPYDRFLPILNNEVVRFKMLNDRPLPWVFANALDLGIWDDYTIDWDLYGDKYLLNLIGFYDEFENEFYLLDWDAEYATSYYIRLTHNPTGCETVVEVPVDPAVQIPPPSFTGGATDKLSTNPAAAPEKTKATSLQVFPNPSTGAFNLQLSNFVAGKFDIQLIDLRGSLVWQTQGSDATYLSLDLNGELNPGIYQVQIQQAGEIIDGKRLVIQ